MKTGLVRYIYLFLGFFFLGVAIFGIITPIMPGTVFLLVSSYFFAQSSERFHNWLINHKLFGRYIRSYKENKRMPREAKIMMGLSFAVSLALVGVLLLF